jgi:hypothetical protein
MRPESEEVDRYDIFVGKKRRDKVCVKGERTVREVKDIIEKRKWNEKRMLVSCCFWRS